MGAKTYQVMSGVLPASSRVVCLRLAIITGLLCALLSSFQNSLSVTSKLTITLQKAEVDFQSGSRTAAFVRNTPISSSMMLKQDADG